MALLLGDVASLWGALALVALVLPKPEWLGAAASEPLEWQWFLTLAVTWLVVAVLTDSYDLTTAADRQSGPVRAMWAVCIAIVGYSLLPFVTPPMLKSRLTWALLFVCGVFAVGLWRGLYAWIAGHPVLLRRAVIVGVGESGAQMVQALREHAASGYVVLGFVAEDQAEDERTVAGLPVLGTATDLKRLIETLDIQELIIAASGPMSAEAHRAISAAYEAGIVITQMTSLYEGLTGQIPVQHVGEQWLTTLPLTGPPNVTYAIAKRGMDIIGGLIGLTVAGLLFVLIAAAILIESGWPVMFSQERVGRRGQPFRIYKFRTLPARRQEASDQTIWERKATRPTKVGRILRRSRLDELPQFWNVLKGDMSLVGPRPYVAADVEELQRHIPFFRTRLLARPGITGWAQIKGAYGATLEDELCKLQYDLHYIRRESIALDVMIMVRTVMVMLRLAGK